MDKRRLRGKLTVRDELKPPAFERGITPEQLADLRQRAAAACNAARTLMRESDGLRNPPAAGRPSVSLETALLPPAPGSTVAASDGEQPLPELPAREQTTYLITITAALGRCAAGEVAAGYEMLRRAAESAADNPRSGVLAAHYRRALDAYTAHWGTGEPALAPR